MYCTFADFNKSVSLCFPILQVNAVILLKLPKLLMMVLKDIQCSPWVHNSLIPVRADITWMASSEPCVLVKEDGSDRG